MGTCLTLAYPNLDTAGRIVRSAAGYGSGIYRLYCRR